MDTPDALASAAAGMQTQAFRLGVIAENLANASTVGYRARRAVANEFAGRLQTASVEVDGQGTLRRTDVPTDLALVGPGYFAVATRNGVEHTRDGRMSVDGQGYLCDASGNRVLGSLGPARFPPGAHIDETGRIIINGRPTDRLRIVFPSGSSLERAKALVRAGYLEDSSVDAIAQMTELVTAERAYEANQKAAQRADESLRRATNDVGVVRA